MSDNYRGVTFADQAVTPADDAIVRRAILPDGILAGCEISYSGSTLTMAAGFLLACGRTFQNVSAQNWAVVDATSGYARLVFTIDLTKTATEFVFKQIESTVEYATSQDGFLDLQQDDINLSGIRYQIEVCKMSLGTGGITGIISQIEKSEAGAGLNFKVVGGLTQPTGLKGNPIWVKTDQPIGNWYFDEIQPRNMQEGDVWFGVRADSPVVLNALKKNAITIRPLFAKQLISGALVTRLARILQNGVWNSFDLLTLATEANGSPYNGGQGWKTGYRLNSSGTDVALDGMEVTGFFPAAYGDTVYLKNVGWKVDTAAQQTYIWCYDSDKNPLAYATASTIAWGEILEPIVDSNNNLLEFTANSEWFHGNPNAADLSRMAYIRLNCESITADSIITTSHPAG